MFDYDAIIVGSGPAGLTAGILPGPGQIPVLIIEKMPSAAAQLDKPD